MDFYRCKGQYSPFFAKHTVYNLDNIRYNVKSLNWYSMLFTKRGILYERTFQDS